MKVSVKPILNPFKEHVYQNGRRWKNDGEESFIVTASDRHGVIIETELDEVEKETVRIKNGTKLGYLEARVGDGIDVNRINSNARRGRVQPSSTPTLQTKESVGVQPSSTPTLQTKESVGVLASTEPVRIRKLTPRECFRLQGFKDEQFDKVKDIMSDTQLYKQAGNSVTVPVIEYIGQCILDYIEEESYGQE